MRTSRPRALLPRLEVYHHISVQEDAVQPRLL